MSLYIILYLFVILWLGYLIVITGKKYLFHESGRYFLTATALYILWLLVYLLSFTTTPNPDILLFFSRTLYTLSLLAMYAMSFYFLYFGTRKDTSTLFKIYAFLGGIILLVSVFTPFIIQEMIYDPILGYYYEEFGEGFLFFSFLYLLNPFFNSFIGLSKYKKLQGINKVRYRYIFIGYSIFIYLFIFFLAFLPIFNIWILQKEQILFFVPFLVSFTYACYRYNFFTISLGLTRILFHSISIILSSGITLGLSLYYTTRPEMLYNVWGPIGIESNIGYIVLAIFLYIFIRKFFFSVFYNTLNRNFQFEKSIQVSQQKIPFLMSIDTLNRYLQFELAPSLKVSDLALSSVIPLYQNLEKFFKSGQKMLINDIVFLMENKGKFQGNDIQKEIDKKYGIYMPLFNSGGNVSAILLIGNKAFREPFSAEDINALKQFVYFLEGHLKYIEIYSQIHDLNLNLDRKVDEKTMEMNTLIQKQKEYISMISHELRSPITSSLFLADGLLEKVKGGNSNQKEIEKDVNLLLGEITKTSEFVKSLFSVEKYDMGKIQLFVEKISISDFLKTEQLVFEKTYPQVHFNIHMVETQYQIDKIQFSQVIHNLIHNAIKFADSKNPQVCVSLVKESEENIILSVEDNGRGIDNIDVSKVFDKYVSGTSGTSGLGLGLYLCKSITEMHGWSISSSISENLGGAKFSILIH